MTAFYRVVLVEPGLRLLDVEDDAAPAGAVWSRPAARRPQFVVQRPWNGLPATWGNGVQASFAAPSPAAVDAA